MAKPVSKKNKHLKLYTEQLPKPWQSQIETIASLPELMQAFQAVTGLSLKYEHGSVALITEDELPQGDIKGQEGKKVTRRASNLPAVRKLAGTIDNLVGELLDTRRTLWQREAELAAGVPLIPPRENERCLAERLEAALRAGAEAVDCDAVALYMLDEATTKLKLRSCWGLPFDRFTAEPRPLEGALADLEALLGHAVVLNDEHTMRLWHVPEDFPAAVCVPVATPTVLLGTLWFFCNQHRDFSDRETNILEVVAGRVAADLEREMLLRAGCEGASLQKQIAQAERLQQNQLPAIAPLIEGWEIAGWTFQAAGVGGAFHDWFCLPEGFVAAAVGRAEQQGVPGAITSSIIKTALRSHARYHRQIERILENVNLTLWTSSAGDQQASLFAAMVETSTSKVACAAAGAVSAWRVNPEMAEQLGPNAECLGSGAEIDFTQIAVELLPGQAILMVTDSAQETANTLGSIFSKEEMAELQNKSSLSAEEMLAGVREIVERRLVVGGSRDVSVLIVKRTADEE